MATLSKHFQLLSALRLSTRSSLLQRLSEVLEEPGAVSSLHRAVSGAERSRPLSSRHQFSQLKWLFFPLFQLEQACEGERTSLGHVTATEAQEQNSILELLERTAQADQLAPTLTALYLTVSAMDGENTLG